MAGALFGRCNRKVSKCIIKERFHLKKDCCSTWSSIKHIQDHHRDAGQFLYDLVLLCLMKLYWLRVFVCATTGSEGVGSNPAMGVNLV